MRNSRNLKWRKSRPLILNMIFWPILIKEIRINFSKFGTNYERNHTMKMRFSDTELHFTLESTLLFCQFIKFQVNLPMRRNLKKLRSNSNIFSTHKALNSQKQQNFYPFMLFPTSQIQKNIPASKIFLKTNGLLTWRIKFKLS